MMEGLTKAKTKQNKTPCETWLEEAERHSLNASLLLEVLMLFQIYERFLCRAGIRS